MGTDTHPSCETGAQDVQGPRAHAPSRREDPRRSPEPRQRVPDRSRHGFRAGCFQRGRDPRGRRHPAGLRDETRGRPINFRDDRRTCVLIASGESAGGLDLSPLHGWPVFAVSDGYRLWKGCEAVYAADWRWWNYHHEKVREQNGEADRWSQDGKACRDFDLRRVESITAPGLCLKSGYVHTGQIGNSGGQAIGIAFTEYGARRFVLVGFDFKGSHFFGEHPPKLRIGTPWDQLARHMAPLAQALAAQGCEVLNCSPISALTYWPKRSLVDALTQ